MTNHYQDPNHTGNATRLIETARLRHETEAALHDVYARWGWKFDADGEQVSVPTTRNTNRSVPLMDEVGRG